MIVLRGLRFMGAHGVLAQEAVQVQPFEVDLELWLDLSEAGRTDDLAATSTMASCARPSGP